MKNLFPFILICLLFTNCQKETTLELNFKGNYDGATLLLDEVTNYPFYGGYPIKLVTLRFYISNITLMNGTTETKLVDIAEIDFSENNKNETDARAGITLPIDIFEAGTYDKIKFNIGVSPDLNATTPNDYSSDHPLGLNNSSQYWESWDSYIFASVEGRQDENNDNDFGSFLYHVGADQFYQTKEISQTIEIKKKKNNVIEFNIDAKKIFSNGTDQVDIVNTPTTHSVLTNPEQVTVANAVIVNFTNAITIN